MEPTNRDKKRPRLEEASSIGSSSIEAVGRTANHTRRRIIRVDVGGAHYNFGAYLLDDRSMLSAMCSPAWRGGRVEDERDGGRIFIDRDGDLFKIILGYLRVGPAALVGLDERSLLLLQIEADYYGLTDLYESIGAQLLNDAGGGIPITFAKDCWVAIREGGGRESGNTGLLTPNGGILRVEKTGTFLLLIRCYAAPHYRMRNNNSNGVGGQREQQYSIPVLDELLTVQVRSEGGGGWETIARYGCFDHRDREESLSDPRFVTASCVQVVNLFRGDEVCLEYPEGTAPPQEGGGGVDVTAAAVFSFQLVELSGDAAVQYNRKIVPPEGSSSSARERRNNTTCARWSPRDPFFVRSTFAPKPVNDDTTIQPPVPGVYLIFGRIAVDGRTTQDPQDWRSELGDDSPHTARLRVTHQSSRTIAAMDTVFLHDSAHIARGNLCEPGAFADIMYLDTDCAVEVRTTGQVALANHGTSKYHAGKIAWQTLTMMHLSSESRFDRFRVSSAETRHRGDNDDSEAVDYKFIRISEHFCPPRDPLMTIPPRRRRLVYNGQVDVAALVFCSLPPVENCNQVALLVDDAVFAISRTLEGSGHCHNFYEVIELKQGTAVSVCCCNEQLQVMPDHEVAFAHDEDERHGRICIIALD